MVQTPVENAVTDGSVTWSWMPIATAPKDGTHVIGLTQWGALEIWWHVDTYDGEWWMDHGDSEPSPTHWVPLPTLDGSLTAPESQRQHEPSSTPETA